MKAGYPRAIRVRRRRDFLVIQREGRRTHTEHLVVIQRPAAAAGSRFGVTASSRLGGAVVRNRLRRVLREVFRRHRHLIASPTDVVVIAKPGAGSLSYAQAATEFARALKLQLGA